MSKDIFPACLNNTFVSEMKFVIAPILILLLLTQPFSKYFLILDFRLNQNYIAEKLCENRSRPELKCKGRCHLMKKMKDEEKQDQNTPGSAKTELSTVLSSRSFFADINEIYLHLKTSFPGDFSSGKPIDRTFPVFHPPSI